MHACDESGDLIIPMKKGLLKKEQIKLLHSLIEPEASKGRASLPESPPAIGSNETTVFKTVGMALNDIFAARYFYNKALEKGFGINLEI